MKNINCKTYYRSEMHRISYKIMQGLYKSVEISLLKAARTELGKRLSGLFNHRMELTWIKTETELGNLLYPVG